MNPRINRFREWLPTLSYDRPVTVLMVFLALLVLGVLSWNRIPLQMMPDGFDPEFLWVQVPYRDASPSETDENIVRPSSARYQASHASEATRTAAAPASASSSTAAST